jgi:three-Cys-motif partner protein
VLFRSQPGISREDGERQFRLPLPARESFVSFPPQPKFKRPQHPLWTENKAKLIERYLYYFVLITRHGTYIDGFAGPQRPDMPQMWAAKLVLESEPKWFRHYYLFDIDKGQAAALERLRNAQAPVDSKGKKLFRDIQVTCADFNVAVHDLLRSGSIGQKEATFCLVDQRTFECHWTTLKALAGYKHSGQRKIELFYFFPQYWMKRAVSALKRNTQQLADWWGRDDWSKLADMQTHSIMETIISRFRDELGYETATPWPIYERHDGGRTMYQMVHATDHPEAPHLMSRAYDKAIQPKETPEQLGFPYEMASPGADGAVT